MTNDDRVHPGGLSSDRSSSDRSSAPTVLVVEDDPAVRELVALHLARAGFIVHEAADGGEGWARLALADVVVLDRMLPDESGDAWLRRLRADPDHVRLPVLMLTARASEVDRVGGLEAGADDYLVKPFSAPELVARLRALLRRVPSRRRSTVGGLVVDIEEARVTHEGTEVELTRREFELIAYLAAHPGRVFARSELLDRVWGEDYLGTERTVDQHVAQLRQRLGDELIETVRGRGYRLAQRDG
ncbi:MAG: response regulator transcription factor [Trueperaceae bacterium]|nr:response regulator transcription factor [Trueperaceae bacterium]